MQLLVRLYSYTCSDAAIGMAPVSASPFFDRAPLVVALIPQAYLFFHVPEDTPLAEGGCMFDTPCMLSWLSWLGVRPFVEAYHQKCPLDEASL